MTIKFPKNQLEAIQHIILPRISFGINSEKYDQTIGTLPPTLVFEKQNNKAILYLIIDNYPIPLKNLHQSKT